MVDAAFSQRRKTLRAALARWAGSADRAERILRAAGVDPGARGESLTVADFARIATQASLNPTGADWQPEQPWIRLPGLSLDVAHRPLRNTACHIGPRSPGTSLRG